MADLKIKTRTIHTITDADFDAFIKEVYGQEFSVVADLETHNDTHHHFSVSSGQNQHDYDIKQLREFAETGRGSYLTASLLRDLCDRGLIEPGEYDIHVSW